MGLCYGYMGRDCFSRGLRHTVNIYIPAVLKRYGHFAISFETLHITKFHLLNAGPMFIGVLTLDLSSGPSLLEPFVLSFSLFSSQWSHNHDRLILSKLLLTSVLKILTIAAHQKAVLSFFVGNSRFCSLFSTFFFWIRQQCSIALCNPVQCEGMDNVMM